MEIFLIIIGILVGAISVCLFFYLSIKSKNVPKLDFEKLKSKFDETVTTSKLNEEKAILFASMKKDSEEKLNDKEITITQLQKEISIHQQKIAELIANNSFIVEKLTHQRTEFEELQRSAHLQFEKIANKLFEEKSSKFTETNKVNLESLLNPLKEDIHKFKTKVEETYDKESKQRFSLDEKIKDLIAQTDKVKDEANNLATALKGKPQKRGNWGEMILERILESSGLTKDREYFVQESMKDEEGNHLRLDVTIKLPDNRYIIIDSKVSLIAYDHFVATEDTKEQEMHLADHLRATYTHIDQLSAKRYDDLENSLDFTMMFMPIEPAYLLAIQNDTDLWAYAYAKRIILVSPYNLIALLKMFSDLWRRDAQNKNAMQIVKRGEALYDKIVGFTKTFEEIGNSLKASQDKYDKALGQLKEGKGNVISQANQLKELGLKSEKKISMNMLPMEEDEENL
jgi:DNA recombination protein RmuC